MGRLVVLRVALVQEQPGHGECLGSFLQYSKDDWQIDLCSGNSYGIFTMYENLGYSFNVIEIDDIIKKIYSNYYDLIIFNSCPLWEASKFSKNKLEKLKSKICVLHHSGLSCWKDFEHDFVKLGTNNLMDWYTHYVYTPYFDVSEHYNLHNNESGETSFYFVGTHYKAGLANRDVPKIQDFFNYCEFAENINYSWFVVQYTDVLREAFANKNAFIEDKSHAELYTLISQNKTKIVFATMYLPSCRYMSDAMTGTIPFALNAGYPVTGSPKFLKNYEFSQQYIDICADLDANPTNADSLSNENYAKLRNECRGIVANKTKQNKLFLEEIANG